VCVCMSECIRLRVCAGVRQLQCSSRCDVFRHYLLFAVYGRPGDTTESGVCFVCVCMCACMSAFVCSACFRLGLCIGMFGPCRD